MFKHLRLLSIVLVSCSMFFALAAAMMGLASIDGQLSWHVALKLALIGGSLYAAAYVVAAISDETQPAPPRMFSAVKVVRLAGAGFLCLMAGISAFAGMLGMLVFSYAFLGALVTGDSNAALMMIACAAASFIAFGVGAPSGRHTIGILEDSFRCGLRCW